MAEKALRMQVNMNDVMSSENVVCLKCGCVIFREAVVLKKVSGILMGSADKQVIAPIPVMVCNQCGEIAPTILEDPKYSGLLDGKTKKENEKPKSNLIL